MQLTIDTANSTRLELRQAAGFLLAIAESVEPVGANLTGALPVGYLDNQAKANQNMQRLTADLAKVPPAPGIIAPADNPESGIPAASEAFKGNALPGAPVAQPTAAQAFQAPAAPSVPTPPPAPAPATPPVAPSAGTGPAPAVAGVQLDKRGLPWDGRIHAKAEGGGGVITKEGIWRAKRGLNDAALVKRIEAELLQALSAPTPAAQVPQPPAPPVVHAPPPAPFIPGANAPVFPDGVPPAPAPTPVPPAPAPAAPVGVEQPTTLPALMALCAPRVNKGHLNMDQIIATAAGLGVPSIPALASRPDIIPQVWAKLAADLAAWGV